MRLLADLHTHTVASGHAYSTIAENVRAARAKGMELIAVTDHGPTVPQGAHLWYFWNLKTIPSVLDGVRVLKGCEATPSATSENGIDLPDDLLRLLDFVAVGMHPLAGFDQRDRVRNTEALLRIIANPLVDQITHPGNEEEFPLDLDAIVAAAAKHRVILELNDHSFAPSGSRSASCAREREFAEASLAAGVPVAIGSDAHFALHIGRFDSALAVAEEIGFTAADIVNRNAESVMAHLLSRRARPNLDVGGVWEWPADKRAGESGAVRPDTAGDVR